MSFPVYVTIGPWSIHPHIFFETLGYFVGFRLYLWLKSRRGDVVIRETRWSVIAAAAVGGLLGSKLLFWFEDPLATLQHLHDPAFLMGGKSIVGGLLGGTVGVEIVKRLIGETRRTGDLFAVPLCLGIAIGRIGCFLTGLGDQTYGVATRLPWGVDLGDGITRHPTQLYEVVFLLLLAFALSRIHFPTQGDTFRAFMVSYLIWRLLVDTIKPEVKWFGLGAIQMTCLVGIAYYGRDIVRWIHTPKVKGAVA
jgi:prolipoprotein diacylglyceryltransferase